MNKLFEKTLFAALMGVLLLTGNAGWIVAAPEKLQFHLQEAKPININHADAKTLQEIRGIGPALAQRILSYRAENGPFRSPEDLIGVPGIGKAKLEKIRQHVTV